jgi:cytoskeletal protein CcmA (bactofilin family)
MSLRAIFLSSQRSLKGMFMRDLKQSRIETLIGKATRVHGDVEFVGGLHLDGHIAGGVRSDVSPDSSLSVSETGSIDGGVEVPNVELHGQIRGDIHARVRIVLGATARVEGNIYYGIIEMTLGAQIIGKLVRLAPEPPAAPAPGAAG